MLGGATGGEEATRGTFHHTLTACQRESQEEPPVHRVGVTALALSLVTGLGAFAAAARLLP